MSQLEERDVVASDRARVPLLCSYPPNMQLHATASSRFIQGLSVIKLDKKVKGVSTTSNM